MPRSKNERARDRSRSSPNATSRSQDKMAAIAQLKPTRLTAARTGRFRIQNPISPRKGSFVRTGCEGDIQSDPGSGLFAAAA